MGTNERASAYLITSFHWLLKLHSYSTAYVLCCDYSATTRCNALHLKLKLMQYHDAVCTNRNSTTANHHNTDAVEYKRTLSLINEFMNSKHCKKSSFFTNLNVTEIRSPLGYTVFYWFIEGMVDFYVVITISIYGYFF